MYIAVDIGGTKTLLALFDEDGNIVKKDKIATDPDFSKHMDSLEGKLKSDFVNDQTQSVCVAIPGVVDRDNGVGLVFGNLPWSNVPVAEELGSRLGLKVVVENDANLAGLGAALAQNPTPKAALYLTVSTGIGMGYITDGQINPHLANAEAGFMQFEHEGKLTPWEKFASGKAISEKYGKLAKDIDDEDIWKAICEDLALGFINLITVLQPDVIILGGGVGEHLDRYHDTLVETLEARKTDQYEIPPILEAPHAEEAVIYGCFAYAKQNQ